MKVSFLILVATLLTSSALRADVIFNNFGADQSFSTNFGLSLNQLGVGVGFTPSGHSYLLDEIDFVASLNSEVPNSVVVDLLGDLAGLPSGTPLETFTFIDQMGALNGNAGVIQAHSANHPLLIQGQQYWVVLTDPNENDNVGDLVWNADGIGALGAASKQLGQWAELSNNQQGALEVQGTIAPVPEPGTLLTLGCGLTGVFWFRRRSA